MILTEPPPSQGDLRFRVFGFPVRVHPLFWLTTGLMGLSGGEEGTRPAVLLMWVAVVFVSILVHELGHAFVQRRFGGRPWITLYGLGGLASCDDCDPSPRSQILISLAGPAAGFLFALAIILVVNISGHAAGFFWGDELAAKTMAARGRAVLSISNFRVFWEVFAAYFANSLIWDLLWVNIFWGLINLLPIYPLDGGRVAREVCTLWRPRRGIILSLQISIVAAGLMAIVGAVTWQSVFTAMMFGYLAYSSYQTLQAYQSNRW